MNKTLYLIRHGQASAGTVDYDRLSPLGELQASLLGRDMRNRVPLPEEIWSGSLLRQQQSAQNFLQASKLGLPVNTDARLNEYDHRAVHHYYHPDQSQGHPAVTPPRLEKGAAIDLSASMPFTTYSAIITKWAEGGSNRTPPEFETWDQFNARALAVLMDVANGSSARTIALFTSGGVISVIAGQLENYADHQIPSMIWELNNASVTVVGFAAGNPRLISHNDVQHLENQADDSLVTKI